MENRFQMLSKADPEHKDEIFAQIQENVNERRKMYEYLAARQWGEN
jgi:pyruvate-ferredoxin/flavodoxin oxidoreductase